MELQKDRELQEDWESLQSGFAKLKIFFDTSTNPSTKPAFASNEYVQLYATVFDMCTKKPPPYDYSEQLYGKYKEFLDEFMTSTVLPSIIGKHDEFMLGEFVQRWLNHKPMVKWLSNVFSYLDRFYIPWNSLPTLSAVGNSSFYDLVYMKVVANVRKAVIGLIEKEREGEQVDRSLLKNVLDIFVEIGMGEMDQYIQDFEVQMLADTAVYYKSKATNWIEADSFPVYMRKDSSIS